MLKKESTGLGRRKKSILNEIHSTTLWMLTY
jgi:hypothetical protein